ncbi:MBL fold metallo-hydrolase [Nocardioides limicola]|uniref:MBL fold metallo-hydrolase n=1 Tax=Nocardioides limicola TaxID=2803368 RepID=UPI00193B0B41|nr:MBL fold metallo-hydrolase [Nocardioides sp. DJM-14]
MTRRGVLAGAVASAAAVGLAGTAAALPPATIAARRKFFGSRNVDPRTGRVRADRVVISWFGCTSYAVAFAGRVMLLDAWVPRGAHSGYVPTTVAEVAALRPFAIFIGHGHFDHARDAGDLARLSGATVVGTAEHCAQAARQAGAPIRTRAVGAESDPYGTHRRFRARKLRVSAIRHPHSAIKAPDVTDPHAPLVPLPDLSTNLAHPPSLCDLLDTVGHAGDAEGGVLLYQFRFRGFRLLWHDSVGPLIEDAPTLPALIRSLPRSDVHLGAVQGFGQLTNGMRDVRSYVQAARAPLFVPGHHDDWGVPVVSTQAGGYRAALEAELARIPAADRPRLRWMEDPAHYLRPRRLTFRL